MYNIENDKYTCDFCGVEQKWDELDENHGEMWSCEVCGKNFCSRCLKRAVGGSRYMAIMQSGDYIMCPDCAQKEAESV